MKILTHDQRLFLNQWFGEGCREVGTPYRKFCQHPRELIKYVELTYSKNYPCYMSVLIYKSPDRPLKVDRLYFDFDAPRVKGEWSLSRSLMDASRLKRRIKRKFNLESLIITSGYGYNLYVFLKDILDISADTKLGSVVLTKVSLKILNVQSKKGAKIRYPTIDTKPIGDIKRISRVPFSIHERNRKKGKMEKRLCYPIDVEIPDLEFYRENGITADIISSVIESVREKQKWKMYWKEVRRIRTPIRVMMWRKTKKVNGIRPCISTLMDKSNLDHLERLVTAFEFINLGWSDDKIVDVFKKQNDFDEKYTRDQLDHARRRGYKRYSCETLRREGKCVPECQYRKG